MSKTIYTGLEGQGKSLKLAMKASDLVVRNSKWYATYGKKRPIASNLTFSEEFRAHANDSGVPIDYWQNISELTALENCDVLIDEVGTYFDSRLWASLSLDARRWLSQGSKRGIEIYGTAQDFAQVDKSFRRLVNELYEIQKVVGSGRPAPTKPPIERVWGLCFCWELDPRAYSEDEKKYLSSIPDFFFIEEKYCKIFDTSQKIKLSKVEPYKHIVKTCEDPTCTYHRVGKVLHE